MGALQKIGGTGRLAIAALLAVGLAVWLTREPGNDMGVEGVGEPLLPGFAERAPGITALRLSSRDDGVSLTRTEDGWTVDERQGYPADETKVGAILRGLALAKLQEPKTANPERFDRVGLGEQAILLNALSSDGDVVATIYAGSGVERGNNGERWTFVRRDNADRAWLASGLPELDVDPAAYLTRDIAQISAKRVSRVEVRPVADEEFTLVRNGAPDGRFTVDDLKDNEQVFAQYNVDATAEALFGLQLADVVPWHSEEGLTKLADLSFYMWDGLTVRVALLQDADEARWVTLAADYDADRANSVDAPAVMPDAPADGAAEAAALNDRWANWLFRLTDGVAGDKLARQRSDIVRTDTPAE